ncbi:MAG: protein-tyrosine-phosphatase [Leptospiraceae bacterium]|nr:MAG: protein-tyrosine-phosphatase [Leptospiraceae bacterium]
MEKKKVKILFVCHGNICRSPAAQGTLEKLIKDKGLENYIEVDSAGTSSYHVGEKPHAYTRKAAEEYGITINHIARQFKPEDFDTFDYIFAMDHYNYEDILRLAKKPEHQKKVHLFREFDPAITDKNHIPDVPDPYYGGYNGFQEVQKIILRTAENLLNYIIENDLKVKK